MIDLCKEHQITLSDVCCSVHTTDNCFVSVVSDNPVGSSLIRIASMMSGARRVRRSNRAAYICGIVTSDEVDSALAKDFGSKMGSRGGYYCHHISLCVFHNICYLRDWLDYCLMPAPA
jgi:hypothetical protein